MHEIFESLDLRSLNKNNIDNCQYIHLLSHKHNNLKIEKYFEFDSNLTNIDINFQDLISIFNDEYTSPVCYNCIIDNVTIGPYPIGIGRYWPIFFSKYYIYNFVSDLARKAWTQQKTLNIIDDKIHINLSSIPKIKIEGTIIWMFLFNNLDHLIRESLPILKVLYDNGEDFSKLKFLTPIISDNMIELLVRIGIPKNNILQLNGQWVVCEKAYIPCFFSFGHLHTPSSYYIETANFIRDRVLSTNINTIKPKYIYVSRNDSEWRRLLNENILIEYLKLRGFTIITPGQFSRVEQISLFSEAEIVIGPHGMGLANAVFSKNLKLLAEIMPTSWNRVSYYRTAQWKKAKYLAYFINPLPSNFNKKTGDYIINVNKFISFIEDHL